MRVFLQTLRYARYFENIPQIIWRITRQTPIIFSAQQKENLIGIFKEIQEPFERHKGDRKNFLSYSYTIWKICELLGYNQFMPMLQLLKAPQNLLRADAIWQLICKDLKYEFIPTR